VQLATESLAFAIVTPFTASITQSAVQAKSAICRSASRSRVFSALSVSRSAIRAGRGNQIH